MELFRNQLVNILYRGIKTINQKIKGINMRKTNKLFLKNQLTPEIVQEYEKAANKKENSGESKFYDMINKKNFSNKIKVYTKDSKLTKLNNVLEQSNGKLEQKYAENKLFYFYFNIVLVDNFLANYRSKLKIDHIRTRLENIINNHCSMERDVLQKCLSTHKDSIQVMPMSDFSKSVNEKCANESRKLEQCILYPIHSALEQNSNIV